jgi:hypothetical protein
MHDRFRERALKLALVTWLPIISSAAELDPALLLCREVQPAARRAECYDQAVDRLQGKTVTAPPVIPSLTTQKPNPQAEPAQTPPAPPVSPAAVFGKSQRETTRILMRDKLNDADLDSLSGRVNLVSRDGLGRLSIVLDNRQHWVQTDNTELTLRAGDTIRIFRSVLGSYQLEKTTGSRRIRVKRLD